MSYDNYGVRMRSLSSIFTRALGDAPGLELREFPTNVRAGSARKRRKAPGHTSVFFTACLSRPRITIGKSLEYIEFLCLARLVLIL